MHFKFDDVNDAFLQLVCDIHSGEIATEVRQTRNGEVLQIPEPVIVTYRNPRARVLFNQTRDANPFGHLYESLWMLAGRNDVAPLDYYFGGRFSNYSDDGLILNGAYGYRWRHALESMGTKPVDGIIHYNHICDQLDIIIDHLKRKPESRRAVLHMSNVEDDLLRMDTTKDQCCNLSVMFSIRNGECETCLGDGKFDDANGQPEDCPACKGFPHGTPRYLDMTVNNRSNDMIWGTLGANYVHFSMLQEYMACSLGLEVGLYHQISNNLHCYTERWFPSEWLNDKYAAVLPLVDTCSIPLVKNRATFDREVKQFVELYSNDSDRGDCCSDSDWREPFLANVAEPMMLAFWWHKKRNYGAANLMLKHVKAPDWQWVARKWIEKRQANWEAKITKIKGEGVFTNE